jgi:hypothetical protein
VVRIFERTRQWSRPPLTASVSTPPLVCLYGRLLTAAWAVLSAIAASGSRMLLSTDYDRAGEQIAAEITREFGSDGGPVATF